MSWFARAARLKSLPVAAWPAVFGLAYATGAGGRWSPGGAAVAVVATALLHLGASLQADLIDHTSGAHRIARTERASIAAGSGAIDDGRASARTVGTLSLALLVASAVAWAFTDGGVLAGAAAVVLAPPWRWLPAGVAEVAQALGRAAFPFAASAAALGADETARIVLAAAVPTGLWFATLVCEGLLQWRADRAVGRRTLPARAESERALWVLGSVVSLTYAGLVALVAAEVLRPWALAALISALPVAGAWGRAYRDPAPQHMIRLLGSLLGAGLITGVALTISEAVS